MKSNSKLTILRYESTNTLYMLMNCPNILVYSVPVSSHFKNTFKWSECKENKFADLPFRQPLTCVAQKWFLQAPKKFILYSNYYAIWIYPNICKKLHLPIGQVTDQIHEPDWKLDQPRVGLAFLCTLYNGFCMCMKYISRLVCHSSVYNVM